MAVLPLIFLLFLSILNPSGPSTAYAENAAWESYILGGDKATEGGDFLKAEEMYKSALAEGDKEDSYGYHVAIAYTRLGALYKGQKEYTRAEVAFTRAISMLERTLGPDHPELAKILDDMINIYVNLSSPAGYITAEAISYRVLAIREKSLGPAHVDVADSLDNLALLVYFPFGHLAQGEPLLQRALAIREKVLGPDHSKVAVSLSTLAFLYDAQGKYEKAEPFYKRALAIFEKNPGPDSPEVLQTLYFLGMIHMNEKKYAQAEVFFKRRLSGLEKLRGFEHPDVAEALQIYSWLLWSMDREEEAKALGGRAKAIREKSH